MHTGPTRADNRVRSRRLPGKRCRLKRKYTTFGEAPPTACDGGGGRQKGGPAYGQVSTIPSDACGGSMALCAAWASAPHWSFAAWSAAFAASFASCSVVPVPLTFTPCQFF